MTATNRNIGAIIKTDRAVPNTSATAGGAGDAVQVAGAIIDRLMIGTPLTAVLAIPFTATLGAGETLSLAWSVSEGAVDDLSDGETLITGTQVVATGGTGGTTETGCLEIDVNLGPSGRYVRADITPTLSAGNTDTAALSGVLITAGADRGPQ